MKFQYRVNEQIHAREVRVVSEGNAEVMSTRQALDIARKEGVDLVKQDIKEIRFGPQTDEHDYQFKLKHAQEFLNEGNKVRAYVFFRGRSILFKEQGEVLLLRFANDLEELAKVEQLPKLEGKKMFLYLSPKKAGITKKSQQRRDREEAADAAKKIETSKNENGNIESKGNVDNNLFANAKNGFAALDKLKKE